jgi:hypothetical protein
MWCFYKGVKGCGYTDQQIHNVDEPGLFILENLAELNISKKEKTQPGFKLT